MSQESPDWNPSSAELLEQPHVVRDGHPPLVVVVRAVLEVGAAAPPAAGDAVLVPRRARRRGVIERVADDDLHRQVRERDAAVGGDEPRVLHVEAVLAVRGDRVRVHREDHVLRELGLDALADLRELDHRHPDRVAGDVAEVVAAIVEALRDRHVHVVAGRARRASPSRAAS